MNHNMEMTEKTTGSGAARWGFYLMGLLILAMGLTLNTKAGLGVSPIISLSYAASVIWNRNFGDMTFVLYGIFVLIQAAIHLREKGKAGRSRGGRLAQGQGGGKRQPHRGGPGTAAGGCDIRPAAVQQRGQVTGHPRRIAALQGQHCSTLLRRQPHGCAALTAQNSAQERQYGALQKRPGHGSGQRGVCRAEVQPA